MKKRIILSLILIIGLISLTGCNDKQKETTNSDAIKFKQEYESFNGEKNEYFEYRNLSINENNPFIYTTAEDIVKKLENKESFIVYFGDPECPWCRSVIEQAVISANENDIRKIYYVRIWDGFHNEILRDTYEVKDGKPVIKSKGTDAYYKIINYFDNVLEEYTLTDENQKNIKVGEKRIFAPNFIYVKEGNAVELIQGISEKQDGYNGELTDEVLNQEKEMFDNFFISSISCNNNC